MELQTGERSLLEGVIEQASRYLLDPPRGSDPVISLASPAELISIFDSSVGLSLDESVDVADPESMLTAVEQIIEYSMHTSHPRFVNQNFAGPDPISVVGDWLGAALNTTGATFEVAPVFTLMESAILTKLGRIAGYVTDADLPAEGELQDLPPGLFAAGGSMGTLFGLQLARHRHQPDISTAGSNGDRLVLFVSASGHYAAAKSAAILGIGSDAVIKVEDDSMGRMIPAALDQAIDDAKAAGQTPFCVIATSGTTVTTAFDDLNSLADICEARELWLHVDGCYGGSALFSKTHAHLMAGVERSDSFVWNLHKMMGMTQQCTALLVKDPTRLAPCFAAKADYLFQSDKLYGEFDSGDRTFQCARRIDVLKLWLSWKARGDAGFEARIDHAFDMIEYTRKRIANSDGALVPVVTGAFTSSVFAWLPPHLRSIARTPEGELDVAGLTEAEHAELHALPPKIKAGMQADGSGMIGYQPIHGLNTFRMIAMSPTLQTSDVDALLDAIISGGEAAISE